MRPALVRNFSYGLVVAAIAFLGFAASATIAFAGPAANFRAYGQGMRITGTPDCTQATGNKLCPGSDSCSCMPISGHGTCAAMGGPVTYTAVVATDLSVDVGGCAEAAALIGRRGFRFSRCEPGNRSIFWPIPRHFLVARPTIREIESHRSLG